MKHNGQIAIEFMLMIGMAFAVVIIFLASVLSVSKFNTETRTYEDIDDLGKALQQEFLLATQMEDGYTRVINLPITLNGLAYNVSTGRTGQEYYILLKYKETEIYYAIPPTIGNFTMGNNLLVKQNSTLRLN